MSVQSLRSLPPAKERLARPSPDFADKLSRTADLLRRIARDFSPAVQASSLGAEDVVLSHLVAELELPIPLFVLQTGALHTETLALLERTQAQAPQGVEVFTPEHSAVLHFVRTQGQDAMYRSLALRKDCCALRKLEPLARALHGRQAWLTGLRREQSGARAVVPLEEVDTAHPGLTKFNPLAEWTWGDIWHYIAIHGVDYNPLHDQFYPSIGCAPCTRAITDGEDFRAGRWWWEDETAKECGLHVKTP
ncbi:MAG: phosphoadenylyl-sulfate reductase [Limnohabitans sp.]|nr:phosphoadenylyl-sulfate reductase [Limnohabitans sp.]